MDLFQFSVHLAILCITNSPLCTTLPYLLVNLCVNVQLCSHVPPPTVSCVAEEARARGNNGVTNVCVIAFAVLLFLFATPGLIAGARPGVCFSAAEDEIGERRPITLSMMDDLACSSF